MQFYQVVPSVDKLKPNFDYDLRPSWHWNGCPQNLCLEGAIDSIARKGTRFVIGKDYYEYELDRKGGNVSHPHPLQVLVRGIFY